MQMTSTHSIAPKMVHSWLRKINLAYVPGPTTPLLNEFITKLLQHFQGSGHNILARPQGKIDVLLTTATYGKPVNWRDAMLFTARRRFYLEHAPLVFTIIQITPGEFQELLDYFEQALAKEEPDPADYDFPGLTSRAYHTLYEQGRRGGPILSVVRLLQSQTMSVRVIVVIGEDRPLEAYTFDLVGAHPRSDASKQEDFYQDLMLRILTAASTYEVTEHEVVGETISRGEWQALSTPAAMRAAGRQLGKRKFFTEMVRVANLVNAPAIHESVSSQYSEGCFATWDPILGALITTITGSARPVAKDSLTDDELAIISGVRSDGQGAQVRQVEGKRNDAPSSEAVELREMDFGLPTVRLGFEWDWQGEVPVARSKLHGHRGVKAYDPSLVEHVPLDPPYYYYPVSCSTEAQARAIKAAFARSKALTNPDDPRQLAFTVLPGHGVVIVEKWVPGKQPLQVIWEFMDDGRLEIDKLVPQGSLTFVPNGQGRMVLQAEQI